MHVDTAELIARYDRSADRYQRCWAPVIAPAALRLLDLVGDAVSASANPLLVDVGTGTGTLALAAVQRWPSVRVIAVDPSAGMVELGRSEASRQLASAARRRIRWSLASADRLPVGDQATDIVVSSFVLQHLTSRVAGLREAHRVLRPGGVLAVVTWMAGDSPFEPASMFDDVLRELGLERPPVVHVPRPFRSLAAAAALARRAGFDHVRATPGMVEHTWTREAYVAYKLNYGERLLDTLDTSTRARLESLLRERLERLAPAAFRYRDRIGYLVGRRPWTG